MDVVKLNWWVWFVIDPFWLPRRGHIHLPHPPPHRGLQKVMEVYGLIVMAVLAGLISSVLGEKNS